MGTGESCGSQRLVSRVRLCQEEDVPFPEEDTRKDHPEVPAIVRHQTRSSSVIKPNDVPLLVVQSASEMETLKQIDDRDVSRVEGTGDKQT